MKKETSENKIIAGFFLIPVGIYLFLSIVQAMAQYSPGEKRCKRFGEILGVGTEYNWDRGCFVKTDTGLVPCRMYELKLRIDSLKRKGDN